MAKGYTKESLPPVAGEAELMRKHLPDVEALAVIYKRRLPPYVTLDELISAGAEALLVCIRRYETGHSAQLWTFAHRRVGGAMKDHVRDVGEFRRRPRVNFVQLDAVADKDSSETHMVFPDLRALTAVETDLAIELWDLPCLGERDRTIIRLHYRDGFTMAAVGQMLGLSESRISQRIKELLLTLRIYFAARDYLRSA